MTDAFHGSRRWVTFAGFVLVVAVLYWAQRVLVPVALAILLTFVLSPLVTRLRRWIGRVPAVLVVVVLAFTLLGLIGWGLANQMTYLAADLPSYRANIRQKIADVRHAGEGGSVEKVQETLEEIKTQMGQTEEPAQKAAQPMVVESEQVATLWGLPAWVSPVLGPLATAGLVIVLVIFMLLQREDLRGRLIGLIGHGHLAVTTKALDEAGQRVSRQLMMQAVGNAIYGAGVGIGLYFIGVPYVLLWAGLAAALRFVPYLGPFIAAAGPLLVSAAALPGWERPLLVLALFVVLELLTNLVLETVLYAGVAGVSQVGLIVAVAFWTWLWGPLGLLMATPLTVCLVVLGKHVPVLEFVSTLMADTPALAPELNYYQRLLARDQSEASDMIDQHIRSKSPETVYDELMLPALSFAERDRIEDRLTGEEEGVVAEATRELMIDAAAASRAARAAGAAGETSGSDRAREPMAASGDRVRILGYPTNPPADELALRMLDQLLEEKPVELEIASGRMLASELVTTVQEGGYRIVCIADLPPSPPSKTRYLVKRLRAAAPELKIVVGRWAPPPLADESSRPLEEAGADHVSSTLLETREQLCQHAALLAVPPAGMGAPAREPVASIGRRPGG